MRLVHAVGDVADGEHVVSAARIDEEVTPENEAEAVVVDDLGDAPARAAADRLIVDDGTGPATLGEGVAEEDE